MLGGHGQGTEDRQQDAPLRDRDGELKLMAGQNGPHPGSGWSPRLFVPLTPHQAPSTIPSSSPGPRAQNCSTTDHRFPSIPWASLGKAFSRAGACKEDPQWASETSNLSFFSIISYYSFKVMEEEEEERKGGAGRGRGALTQGQHWAELYVHTLL